MQSPSRKQVVLLVETSNSYGRSVLSGIVRYMRMHDEWSVYLEQRDLTAKPPAWLMDWKGDGIISRVTTPELLEATRTTGVPVVDVTDRKRNSGFVSIRTDDERVGELGAEHLMERGFQRFGFCGYTNEAWSERRLRGFRRKLDSRGLSCTLYSSGWLDFSSSSWEEEQEQLTLWLRSQKRPIGIMACNDIRGHNLITACAREGFAVPEEVAILGVDNDELLCRVCDPALSSVVVNAEGVGFRAAETLDLLMQGKRPSEPELWIEPLGISVRQSTEVVAIDDPDIAAALQFIRQNATRGITVEDVVENSTISRSSLERKVRKYLGRTPQEEIRNVQIKKVKELLTTTDLSAERIASLCGFEHSEYMYVVFKRHVGMTPGDFRVHALQG